MAEPAGRFKDTAEWKKGGVRMIKLGGSEGRQLDPPTPLHPIRIRITNLKKRLKRGGPERLKKRLKGEARKARTMRTHGVAESRDAA